ncbi:MAG TPA: 50S ribosomal protein L21 [Acidimicrobiales bacterium]|jgi:large subunit ribosomal protein L21|nr:50S ribosomal protein L21 [Acidimicrobiales bacterium]
MYAVIKTGGKQYRVEKGQQLDVELLGGDGKDGKVELKAVLLVDGDTVLAGPKALAKAKVTAKVVGETKGPKITGFTYKNKTRSARRWGHRQRYSTIEITAITKSSRSSSSGRSSSGSSGSSKSSTSSSSGSSTS